MIDPRGVGDGVAPQLGGQGLDQLGERCRTLHLAWAAAAEPANPTGHVWLGQAPAPSRRATKSTAWPTVSMLAASSSGTLTP